MPKNNLKHTDETSTLATFTPHHRLCVPLSEPHPDSARMTHMHQAVLPGTYLTFELTTCWQKGQETVLEKSVRYAGKMGTGRGWVTTTDAGVVWVVLPGGVTPTRHKV